VSSSPGVSPESVPVRRSRSARSTPERDACGIGFVADSEGRVGRNVVELALTGLACVKHRGAIAADGLSGDGAGILTQIPRAFFARVAREELGAELDPERIGVIGAYLDAGDADARAVAEATVAKACAAEGIEVVGWRDVPVDITQIGAQATADLPAMRQAIIVHAADVGRRDAEKAAYRARRVAETQARTEDVRAYFCSWSFVTVTYKALVISDRLAAFYPDLTSEDFASALAIFHSRFSTNTAPAWERAQPFRLLCHNGEINTLRGNEQRMAGRGHLGTVEAGLGPEETFRPMFAPDDSDSGKLDATVELLLRGGRDVRHAVAMVGPEAWEGHRDLAPGVRDFYRYHACLSDPWDGPAGLVFTDGVKVGAALDRNGLRPMRWQVCDDGLVVCASEVGAVPIEGHGKVRRGRLGPGQMLSVDPELGVQGDTEVKSWLAHYRPYGDWARDGLLTFGRGLPIEETPDAEDLMQIQAAYGVTKEELAVVIKPMATDAKEPTFSMGDDTPFAAVATKPRPVAHFLRQRFAQVTNPPIDHLRERLVMSLRTCLGPRQPILTATPEAAQLLELATFFLYPSAIDELLDEERVPFSTVRLDATFPVGAGTAGLEARLDKLASEAMVAVHNGAGVIVLSDAKIGPERAPIPSVLSTGAVHQRLVAEQVRPSVSLVLDSGDARDTHAIACLLGFGADAVSPRVGLQTVASLADNDQIGSMHASEAQAKYQASIEDGVLKIMSKMGISTLDGYRYAQVFEALGLAPEVVDRCFRGAPSQVGGIGFEILASEILARHGVAFGESPELDEPGFVRFRKRGGEYHANNPDVIDALHLVSDLDGKGGKVAVAVLDPSTDVDGFEPDPNHLRAAHLLQRAIKDGRTEIYEQFRDLIQARPITELHDLLEVITSDAPIPLDEVEPATAITTRFSTGAMSHGSLSAEAHETLAEAVNLIGGRSNCGEGGEDPARFRTRGTAHDKNSKIKQIASGRFGVTPQYCAFADELNIKMAQGSKPGEGGQLPGHKVSREIARLRHTQPNIGLISPPPHHDIYSIEDLAQLIFDLKQVNTYAEVSVKLVAEEGVGQIATGVVKALADTIQISGANGGTGASPLSSIKHAGMPWELGLADAQLVLNQRELRDRVKLRVDGGFKTGRDVIVAALMGADEFSFGTAALVAEGCIMVRACHKDTCPTGIATQRPNLRAKFAGTPEGVAQYLLFVAEEVRELLASLGLRTLDEAIGRVELLRQRTVGDARADSLDLELLLRAPEGDSARRFVAHNPIQRPRSALDERLLLDGFRALWEGDHEKFSYTIDNADRTIGASIGGAIGLEWGDGLPPGLVDATFTGSAGQSFGAFLSNGVKLELVGEANDYVGKGMGGGLIVVRPPEDDAGDPVLAGNTCLYGATGGKLYVAGRVGERFGVRNSGATAVVEGTGDHACEYMTGGTVVILGDIGYNLGAGMTGGQAFVYDPEGMLQARLNRQLVEAATLDQAQASELAFLVLRHHELTGSPRASEMMDDWDAVLRSFWRVGPVDEVARIERANEGVLGSSR
jgi:glutamate synthase domain-containing protein 2/glutamate synthase domain-containing protein 1/glutamate synthase domain-containing protein 3